MVAYSNLSNSAVETTSEILPPGQEILELVNIPEAIESSNSSLKFSKQAIRRSLRASTCDGVFAAIFTGITSGVLLGNFLLELGASTAEIGILSALPMLVNLLQPLGAYLSGKTTSRYKYNVGIFGPSRLLWLILVPLIWFSSGSYTDKHNLLFWTLAIVLASNVLSALGCPSWLSWIAGLVPERLRGRYFGFRNRAASLTSLICVPLLGFAVSAWPGGSIEGYGILLLLAAVVGIITLVCQFFMADVNPQELLSRGAGEQGRRGDTETPGIISDSKLSDSSPIAPHSSLPRFEPNFLRFLAYFGFWTFAANLSSPFYNLYLLDDLAIDVTWVTLYNSLSAGANLLMLVLWGKLADRIGNRPILLLVGILVAVTPLLWLGTSHNAVSLWVWLPLLHLLSGGTWAAIDLCSNNIQMSLAPTHDRATYFAIAAAVAGVGGASATIVGGFLAEFANMGGLLGLFVLSAVMRSIALLPLLFVREERSQPLRHVVQSLKQKLVLPKLIFPAKPQLAPVVVRVTEE